MTHLLVNCDLSWARDREALLDGLRMRFNEVTCVGLDGDLDALDLSSVTHWITNPAPRQRIERTWVEARMPALTWLGSPSTGTTHIDLALRETDVRILCLRDVPPEQLARITSSSEHTFFLFLALVRRAKVALGADLRAWRDDLDSFRGRQVHGMRALVFGHGRIGSNVARYLNAFGADVLVHEPNASRHVAGGKFVDADGLQAELGRMDVVFLCFHWSPENDRFFDAARLDAMREDAFLVNTSRGENLDEAHLAELIERGKFAGVALDVLQGEQREDFASTPILGLAQRHQRVLITPHVAGASYDSERLAFEFVLDALD